MIILREYYENIREKESKDIIHNYGNILRSEGWRYSISEGGYIHPNRICIFYIERSPYQGQLICLHEDKENDFKKLIIQLITDKIFISTKFKKN